MPENELLKVLEKFRAEVIQAFATLEVEISTIQHSLVHLGIPPDQYSGLRLTSQQARERFERKYADAISPLRSPA